MTFKYTVSLASGNEGHDLALEVWLRNFPNPGRFRARHEWYYHNNPYSVYSFLLTDDKQRRVGAAGLSERSFSTPEGPRRVGLCSDFAIDAADRCIGPALRLQKTVIEKGLNEYPLLYGFPNERAAVVMKRAGYVPLGKLHSLALMLDSDYYLLRRWPGTWSTAVSRALDGLTAAWIRLLHVMFGRGCRMQETDMVDARFDTLWSRCAFRTLYTTQRTRAFLEWRFTRSPVDRYRIFTFTLPASDELCGYAVVRNRDGHWHLVDFLPLTLRYLPMMMTHLLRAARNENVKSVTVEFLGPRAVVLAFRAIGFYPRPTVRCIVFKSRDSVPDLLRHETWYVTGADED